MSTIESLQELANKIEAILFVAGNPVKRNVLKKILNIDEDSLESAIQLLKERYKDRGIKIEEISDGWQFTTVAKYRDIILKYFAEKPFKLSQAALEVLTIIAYKQPVTKAEIEAIRGMDSSGAIKTLLSLGIVRIMGRKEEPGRPFVYGTTDRFLEVFRINSLKELPRLREIKEIIKEGG